MPSQGVKAAASAARWCASPSGAGSCAGPWVEGMSVLPLPDRRCPCLDRSSGWWPSWRQKKRV